MAAAQATGCAVVGIDLIVPAVDRPDYVIVEANEQPGLGIDPQKRTVKGFVDLLFPGSA